MSLLNTTSGSLPVNESNDPCTGAAKTRPGTPGDEMVYWGLQDQTIDWWMSDLIAAQNVYYSRGTVDQQVFNPN